MAVLDLALQRGSPADRSAAAALQRRLLADDSKESGVLQHVVAAMRAFPKHDRKIAKQDQRETRSYACDLVRTAAVVLRAYERLCGGGGFAVRSGKSRAEVGVDFGKVLVGMSHPEVLRLHMWLLEGGAALDLSLIHI